MPTSPNSLTMTASRRPPAFSSTCRISVVFPAPRKPVTTVQGTRAVACESVMAAPSGCRDAGMRATSPRFSASGRARNGMNPSVEVAKSRAPATRSAPLVASEPAEDVAPAAGAEDRRRQPAPAVAEAGRPAAPPRRCPPPPRRVSSASSAPRPRLGLGLVRQPAGAADQHRHLASGAPAPGIGGGRWKARAWSRSSPLPR